MFSAYYGFRLLEGENTRVPRYELAGGAGGYEPIARAKTKAGELRLYLHERSDYIKQKTNSIYSLEWNAGHISSVFELEGFAGLVNGTFVGFGTAPKVEAHPQSAAQKKTARIWAGHDTDGFIFFFSQNMTRLEWLIMPDGKRVIKRVAAAFARGVCNYDLEYWRRVAFGGGDDAGAGNASVSKQS